MLQVVLKTKNDFCLKRAEELIDKMRKSFKNELTCTASFIARDDSKRGYLVTIDGLGDAQVIIGSGDGSYIHTWWLSGGQMKFFDIELSYLQRIISL